MLKGFKIGHFTDEEKGTGCTVILSEDGAVGGVSVRGAAPATRETDLLHNGKSVQKINAVVLSGGSAFGLEAASGVVQYLYEKGCGYRAGEFRVPIVTGASLFDLAYKTFAFPDKQAGYAAAKSAEVGRFETGSIGAGTGATVSKLFGATLAAKGGLGVQTMTLNGIELAVIVAVNPLGDIIKEGRIVLGARGDTGEYLDVRKGMSAGAFPVPHGNTTIGCIITNAALTKEQANILADVAHDGYALSISPAHTPFDGDAMFCMASGEKQADISLLSALVPELTAKAVQSVAENTAPIAQTMNPFAFKLYQKLFRRKD